MLGPWPRLQQARLQGKGIRWRDPAGRLKTREDQASVKTWACFAWHKPEAARCQAFGEPSDAKPLAHALGETGDMCWPTVAFAALSVTPGGAFFFRGLFRLRRRATPTQPNATCGQAQNGGWLAPGLCPHPLQSERGHPRHPPYRL